MHEFAVVVEEQRSRLGETARHVVVPASAARALRDDGATCVRGDARGRDLPAAAAVGEDGTGVLRFGRVWSRRAGVEPGDVITVRVEVDPDPDVVDLPDELVVALEADPEAEHLWDGLTPGRQRSPAYHVDRGARPETRQRRAAQVCSDLRSRQ